MKNPFEKSDLKIDPPGRGRIYNNVLETFGNTPLVRLGRLDEAKDLDGDPLDNAIRSNARRVARLLEQQDPILSGAVESGELTVVTACYRLDSGQVEFLDP
mgnify:CR=1 FL=1